MQRCHHRTGGPAQPVETPTQVHDWPGSFSETPVMRRQTGEWPNRRRGCTPAGKLSRSRSTADLVVCLDDLDGATCFGEGYRRGQPVRPCTDDNGITHDDVPNLLSRSAATGMDNSGETSPPRLSLLSSEHEHGQVSVSFFGHKTNESGSTPTSQSSCQVLLSTTVLSEHA
jgi:hypothetical protein